MIASFITGSVSRFLLRFVPSLLDLYMIQLKQKHDMAMAQLHVDSQINIKELESDAPLRMDKLDSMKPKTKIEWIVGFNDLMRPLTTIVWVVVYPAVLILILKYDILRFDPFEVLSLFSQDVIGLILGFWYTDGIVRKRA